MGTFTPRKNSGVIAGPVLLKLNDSSLKVEGELKYNMGAPKQEIVQDSVGDIVGVKQTPQPGKISGSVFITPVLEEKLGEVVGTVNGLISFMTPTGKTLTLSKATFVGDGDVDTGSGKMDFEFQGVFL